MATSRLLLVVLLSACATTPRVNEPAAALVALDGSEVSVAQLTGRHELTVFSWWASSCPCVARYEARLQALRARHPEAKVGVYAIVSNADETLAGVKAETTKRGLDLPVLFDPGARLAGELGVRSTPTVVLFDREGQLLFKGWMDNERQPGEPNREPWLDQAIETRLAGRTDHMTRSPTWGCPITRSLLDDLPACCRAQAATGDEIPSPQDSGELP